MRNNLNLDLVNIISYANFCQIPSIRSQDTERKNKIVRSIKGHNSVINLWKLTHDKPNLDLVNINASANLVKSHRVDLKILSRNEILT